MFDDDSELPPRRGAVPVAADEPAPADAVRAAAALKPWVVINGAPDSQFLPSHLAAQGFWLLRGRTPLREIANILLK